MNISEYCDKLFIVVRILDHDGKVLWFSNPIPKGEVNETWKAPVEGWLDAVAVGENMKELIPLSNVFGTWQLIFDGHSIQLTGTGEITAVVA